MDDVDDAEEAAGCLEPDELASALSSLGSADLKRLTFAGRAMAGDDGDDLIAEAVRAAMEGRRRCPRGLPIAVFLKNAMKSLASSEKKKAERAKVLTFPVTPGGVGSPIDYAADPSADPEQVLLDREDDVSAERASEAAERARAMLMNHFDDDFEAQLCIEGMLGGLKGEELRGLVGVDQPKLDYTRKRLRRAAVKLFPKGWRNV